MFLVFLAFLAVQSQTYEVVLIQKTGAAPGPLMSPSQFGHRLIQTRPNVPEHLQSPRAPATHHFLGHAPTSPTGFVGATAANQILCGPLGPLIGLHVVS